MDSVTKPLDSCHALQQCTVLVLHHGFFPLALDSAIGPPNATHKFGVRGSVQKQQIVVEDAALDECRHGFRHTT
jgi:hypothetical protein